MLSAACKLSCLKDSRMAFQGAVLKGQSHCQSVCQNCISQGEVCTECSGRHRFVHPALRACKECLEKDRECVKMICLAWVMDSESKNKNSQTILTKRQSDTDSTTDTDLVTAFPDPMHVAKNDRASFANWYRLVDGYQVNLVLLRTARTDPVIRDRMDVDTVVEICSPEVRKGLQRVNWIVQTLVPEVYRLYDRNEEGVLKCPVSVCPASWGTLLVGHKEKGKIFSTRLHYPVDVVEIVAGLSCPVAITYSHGLLLITDLGKQQIVCSDLRMPPPVNQSGNDVIKNSRWRRALGKHSGSRASKKKIFFYRLNQGSNLKSSDVVSDVLPLHH